MHISYTIKYIIFQREKKRREIFQLIGRERKDIDRKKKEGNETHCDHRVVIAVKFKKKKEKERKMKKRNHLISFIFDYFSFDWTIVIRHTDCWYKYGLMCCNGRRCFCRTYDNVMEEIR